MNQQNIYHNTIISINEFNGVEETRDYYPYLFNKDLHQYNFYRKLKNKSLNLLDFKYHSYIFDHIPRSFIITTNNNIIHKFNIELLKDTSSVISNLLKESPDTLQYHLNIDDKNDVLGKFEQIYQGKTIFFNENEFSTAKRIVSLLNIIRCTDILKEEKNQEYDPKFNYCLSSQHFNNFLHKEVPQSFTIVTHNAEYKCNIFGICSSKVILDLITKDPKINKFVYDFDDDFNEFQIISDLFNFDTIEITTANMYSLKEIMNDLQITIFNEKIDKFIKMSEKVSQTIDDQETLIDSNEELFDWLYHIKENNVETVKNLIVNSNWIKTDENVQEFVAFILQVIRNDSTLHSYIIELLIMLDKESNETNSLEIMMPFLIKKLTDSFGDSLIICAFVYILNRKGFISNEQLIDMIKETLNESKKTQKRWSYKSDSRRIYNLASWFYPEIKNHPEIEISIDEPLFIRKYFPGKADEYLEMRDNGEPDDELTKALRNDDVDTLQKIIIKNGLNNQEKFSKAQVPFNLYEDFVYNGITTYINYACAYGSIKCFKYLLLNHATFDAYTLSDAVFGGNIEIIKTVNQILSEKDSDKNTAFEPIIPSIIKHQNDIFDWIFQEKYSDHKKNYETMLKIVLCAAENGNAHAMIEIIENGFDFISASKEIFAQISKNGYLLLTKIFLNLFQKTNEEFIFLDFSYSGYFDNISIFKIALENIKYEFEMNDCLKNAIQFKCMKVIRYFFQNAKRLKWNMETVLVCLSTSIYEGNNELFNYLAHQFEKIDSSVFHCFNNYDKLLSLACSEGNVEISMKIVDMIIKGNHEKEDFTDAFYNAVISDKVEICKYIIEKKFLFNCEKFSNKIRELSLIEVELFSLIIENTIPESRVMFLSKRYLDHAIQRKNKNLIKYLLKTNVFSENALFLAVSENDIDLVNLILKYNSKSSFVNKVFENGTVLCIAVENKNLLIVKRLLSIPGINLNLYNKKQETPLLIAVKNFNLDISTEILNYYDKNDLSQEMQFNQCFKILFEYILKDKLEFIHYYYQMDDNNGPIMSEDHKNQMKSFKILKKILEFKAINPNCFINDLTILLFACQNNEIDIVKTLLQNDKTDPNLYSTEEGNSPLMVSIENRNFEIAKILIEHPKTNLNARNFMGETALTLSVSKNYEDIVSLLINNERFDPEESCIDRAFYFSSGNISRLLSTVKSLDVNYLYTKEYVRHRSIFEFSSFSVFESQKLEEPPQEGQILISTLLNSIKNNDIDKIDLIINHPSFDRTKSRLIKSIFATIEDDQYEMFEKLIKSIDNDVNICDSNRKFLLNFAIENKRTKIAKYILDCPNLDPNNIDILEVFSFYVKNNNDESLIMMNKIYNYDQEHLKAIDFNKLLPTGESFFTLIASQQFNDNDLISIVINSSNAGEIASFLIDHGVDPNAPDKNGFYPLEYAILLESADFVRALLNSNQINLSQIVELKSNSIRICEHQLEGCLKASSAKQKTYLHIAARSKNSEILKDLVEKNVIDVNSCDELGETPLFEACRFNQLKNIEYFATLSTVDYSHCNNDEKDALTISMELLDKNSDNEIKTREDYFKKLISLFKKDKNNQCDLCFFDCDQLD